eukprot:4670062-Prymnesium_polylepis.1
MPGWGRSMWYGRSTLGGGGCRYRGPGGSSSSSWVFGGAEGVLVGCAGGWWEVQAEFVVVVLGIQGCRGGAAWVGGR